MSQPFARILLILLLGAAIPAVAQNPAGISISRAGLQAHTEFLASDLLEGRAAASRGYELAAAYVAAQFRQFGLVPATGNNFLQAVPLLEAIAVLPGASAVLLRDGEEIRFEYGSDFLPAADFLASNSSLSAPLTFAGFGISAPDLQYDDFADIDVTGRIVMLLSGAPARFTAAQRAYHGSLTEKYANLARRGAVGAIVVEAPAAEGSWERHVALSWVPDMRRVDDNGVPIDVPAELKLRFRFSNAAAAKFFPEADHGFEQTLAQVEAGEARAFHLPGTLTLTATTGLRRTTSSNVVGVLRGSDSKLRNEFVVLTAHLDHLGRGPAVNGDSIYNGAHDNAVGVAMLLETARALSAMTVRPKRSIVFAAVTAGERGGFGADYLVRQGGMAHDAVVANVDLDTPLPLARSSDVAAVGADHSSLGNIAAEAVKTLGLGLAAESPQDTSPLEQSAGAFIRAGIPSLSLKTGNRARARKETLQAAKQDYRQNHYRQPSDEIGEGAPIDYAAAADLTALHARIAYDIAEQTARPHWYRTSLFFRKFRDENR